MHEWMPYFYSAMIGLEILMMNIGAVHLFARKKASNWTNLIVYILCTLFCGGLLFLGAYSFKLTIFSSIFLFLSFLFVFPMKKLYHEPMTKIFTLLCMSSIFSITICALANCMSQNKMITEEYLSSVLFYQTILFLVCSPFYWLYLNTKFRTIIRNSTNKTERQLCFTTILWFLFSYSLYLMFITNFVILKPIVIVLLLVCALVNYHYHEIMNQDMKNISQLKELNDTDMLTKIYSRNKLFLDLDNMIEQEESFHLIFCDLDFFKQINDCYGHVVGDEYLTWFGERAKEIAKRWNAKAYRLSGDEFIFIATNHAQNIVDELYALQEQEINHDLKFLGLSLGVAVYPEDDISAIGLISYADFSMYSNKSKNNQAFLS